VSLKIAKTLDTHPVITLRILTNIQWKIYTVQHNMKYRQGIGSPAIFNHVSVQYGDTESPLCSEEKIDHNTNTHYQIHYTNGLIHTWIV
jgi:hypothetical protein